MSCEPRRPGSSAHALAPAQWVLLHIVRHKSRRQSPQRSQMKRRNNYFLLWRRPGGGRASQGTPLAPRPRDLCSLAPCLAQKSTTGWRSLRGTKSNSCLPILNGSPGSRNRKEKYSPFTGKSSRCPSRWHCSWPGTGSSLGWPSGRRPKRSRDFT